MAKRTSAGNEVNLDSFLDIMTCLVGVLVLIIILTGIDAAQIKVLINTPMSYHTDKRQLFIECRNNQLFVIPIDELNQIADERLNDIARDDTLSHKEVYRRALAVSDAGNEQYNLDLVYSLVGQMVLNPVESSVGYPLADKYVIGGAGEPEDGWYNQLLDKFNRDDEMLSFLVRDDSFRVFKIARALAWMERIDVAYQLLDGTEQIRFGINGERVTP
ncbi:MAG: hypothetical protein AAF492_29095, partial [Verrucomicrobiota bacterium]